MTNGSGLRRLSGKRALLEQLVTDRVTAIFGNPGTTEQGFMDLLSEYPSITFYHALHEGVAIAMADSYARATGRPSFAEVHIAPGLGNSMGMLYNAWAGGSPVVVYAGQGPVSGLFQQPYLWGDMVAMARPITKWSAEITEARDVPQAIRRAFKIAADPPQGPVFLSLPIDALDAEAEVSIQPTTFVRRGVRPPQDAVEEAADWLAGAAAPAIAVGDNVFLSSAQEGVVALAELLGAPMLNAFSNGVNAPAGHPLYQPRGIPIDGGAVRKALEPHDVLLAVGTSLFSTVFPDPLGPIPEGTRVVHVDFSSWELGKNHAGDILIHAEPKDTLVALEEALLKRADSALRQEWAARRSRLEVQLEARRKAARKSHLVRWDSVPISPNRLMAEVAAAIPEDAIVFDEAITSGANLEMYLQPNEPWRRFRNRGGAIGGGLPGTLGVQVAFPDRPVVGVVSDGASMYTITALWTAAHHRLPVTFVVCNNGSYKILKENLMQYRGPEDASRPFVALDLREPELRFDRLAEAMGVEGRRIEHPEEIAPALRAAIAAPRPVLLDIIVSETV